MDIRLAKTAGFCMGVRRAVDIAQDAASIGPVLTHGPLIHNAQAVDILRERGVIPAENLDESSSGRIVIRAHGIPQAERERLEKLGYECIDATCPRVLASQKRIAKASKEGKEIVLAGDRDHAEMVGLAGHATTPTHIISTAEEAHTLQVNEPFVVLAQTTFSAAKYAEICAILEARFPGTRTYDSICMATSERQTEVREIAAQCDATVVVGGKHSANTVRLAEIARETGKPTYHIETAAELNLDEMSQYATVGVTAGASTPGWLTQTVIDRLHESESQNIWSKIPALFAAFIKSYLYTATAAVFLTGMVSCLLPENSLHWEALLIVFAYIFTVYTFNRRAISSLSNAVMAPLDRFYQRHKVRLFALAGVLAGLSFASAIDFGHRLPFLLGLAYLGGILYAIPLLPRNFHWRRLKDIPASKDIFVAVAWVVVVVGAPAIVAGLSLKEPVVIISALIVFLLIFAKTVALDLRDTEGDRLIGSETLPILIGKNLALRLLYAVQIIIFFILAAATASGIFPSLGWWACLLPIYGLGYLRLFHKGLFSEEVRCQAIIDGQLILAGILALVYEMTV